MFTTAVLFVVLYGCETWTLTLKERSLVVFVNRVLRRIFGPRRDEVTGGWRKLHNDELHSVYSSSSIIRDGGLWLVWEEVRNACKIFI
jgi:hypothetical protein